MQGTDPTAGYLGLQQEASHAAIGFCSGIYLLEPKMRHGEDAGSVFGSTLAGALKGKEDKGDFGC